MCLQIFKYMPDDPLEIELKNWFLALFFYIGANKNISAIEIIEALDILADRQWHSLKPLNKEIVIRVDNWIKSHWEVDDQQFQIILFRIISSLGLLNSYDLIKNNYENSNKISSIIKSEIKKQLEENREYVVNPYYKIFTKKK